jgi:cation:H+ antiporter
MRDGKMDMVEGILELIAYSAFLLYIFREGNQSEDLVINEGVKTQSQSGKLRLKEIAVLIVSGVFIYLGANYTIDALEHLAEGLA